MSKPTEQHQAWLDRNPCALCGTALNRPNGRERSFGSHFTLTVRSAGGEGRKVMDAIPSRGIVVGMCCAHLFTQTTEESQ
jgi:hypothetical protein